MKVQRVLVVDDSEADHFLTKVAIRRFDASIEVIEAWDGGEACEVLAEEHPKPDVIFLDINMPLVSGHAFLEKYAERADQAAVVVMLSSSLNESDRKQAEAYDFVLTYVNKPLSRPDMEKIVEAMKERTAA